MRILAPVLFGTNVRQPRNISCQNSTGPALASPLACDTVSFTSKITNNKLDIKEPTNHCAYCGEKLYTQKELDSLCQELLSQNSHRLEGKIISVSGKLESKGKTSALAEKKREVNSKEIEFFKDFMDKAQKHPRLSGREILTDLCGMKNDAAAACLKKNLSPLLRTIDHVLPQKTRNGNIDDEMNLVETCYTCNNHIKNGEHFYTFLSLYPSISDYMPAKKYEYAALDLMQNPAHKSAEVSSNILKFIDDAQTGQREAQNKVNSFGKLIQNLMPAANMELERVNGEITGNNQKIKEFQSQFKKANNDPEFAAMRKKMILEKSVEQLSKDASAISGQINDKNRYIAIMKNAPVETPALRDKKNKKFTVKSEKERSARLKEAYIGRQKLIEKHKEVFAQLQSQRAQLESVEVKQIDMTGFKEQKEKYEQIIDAHKTIDADKKKMPGVAKNIDDLQQEYEFIPLEDRKRAYAHKLKAKLRQNETEYRHLENSINRKQKLCESCTLQQAQREFDKNDLLIKKQEAEIKAAEEKQAWLEIERNIKALEHDNSLLQTYAEALQRKINECTGSGNIPATADL